MQFNWPSFKFILRPEGEKGENKTGAKFFLYTVHLLTRKKGRDLTQSYDKTKKSITQLLTTNLGRSAVWLNLYMSTQPSH